MKDLIGTLDIRSNAAKNKLYSVLANSYTGRLVHKWATTDDVDSGVMASITDKSIGSTSVAPLSADSRLSVTSTDAADAAAGTGIQALSGVMVNSSYEEVSFSIVPTGTTTANTAASETGIVLNDLWATAVGSGGRAAGNIRCWSLTGANGMGGIRLNLNKAQHAHYMVPANKQLVIYKYGGFPGYSTAAQQITFSLCITDPEATILLDEFTWILTDQGGNGIFEDIVVVDEKSFVAVYGEANSNNMLATGGFSGILIDKA